MKLKERSVSFYEITFHTNSVGKHVSIPNQTDSHVVLTNILPFLKKGLEIGKSVFPIEVTDFSWNSNNGELALLLNRPDPELSDVSYRDRRTHSRRSGNKKNTEAIELSAHAIIKPVLGTNIAELKMTTGAKTSAMYILSLLRQLYGSAEQANTLNGIQQQPTINNSVSSSGAPNTFSVRHSFALKGLLSTALSDIIKAGKITGVDLIDNQSIQFDSSGQNSQYGVISQKTIQIEVTAQPQTTKWFSGLFKSAETNHNFDADAVRVVYKDSSNEPHSKTINRSQLNDFFTRRVKITLQNDHPQHQAILAQEILAEMRKL